jgi:hypothetical protein
LVFSYAKYLKTLNAMRLMAAAIPEPCFMERQDEICHVQRQEHEMT